MIRRMAGSMFDAAMRYLTRKTAPVSFNDRERNKPISAVFGVDRGTPIDRYYIEAFLRRNARLIKGRILEIGDSHYSRRFAGGRLNLLRCCMRLLRVKRPPSSVT